MMDKLRTQARKKLRSENVQLLIVSIIFGCVFGGIRLLYDDVYWIARLDGTVKGCWAMSASAYYTWSSRVLINFVWFLILLKPHIGISIYMMVSVFVFLKALTLLWNNKHVPTVLLFSVTMFLLIPYAYLNTAGWIATLTSYFGPPAFALMSLVPIKKVMYMERIKGWELVLYVLAIVYGTNSEQNSIVICGLYAIAILYLTIVRKANWKLWLMFLLSIASVVFMFTCPGNWNRDGSEEITWFPTYAMMDVVDKADLGLSTTLRWIFAENNLLVIVLLTLMAIVVIKKYNNPLLWFIASVPLVATFSMGPFKDVMTKLFPFIGPLSEYVDYYGAFTVASMGFGNGAIQFLFFLLLALFVCAELFIVNDSVEGILADVALIIMGVASRCMMGFSPTIYGSGPRTYLALIICIISVTVHVFASNYETLIKAENNSREAALQWGVLLLMAGGGGNLIYYLIVC